jgi:cytochrome P450
MYSYYKEFGHLVKHDFCGNTELFLFHPEESMKIFRNEGPYPNGIAGLWPVDLYLTHRMGRLDPLSTVGPDWKRMRSALQKDMFPHKVAESYLPVINQAARNSLPFVPMAKEFSALAPFAAFDLFMSVMLGKSPRTTASLDSNEQQPHPDDVKFAQNAIMGMGVLGDLLNNPALAGKVDSPQFVEFKKAMDFVLDRAYVLTTDVIKEIKTKEAYAEHPSYLEEEAVMELCNLLFAGVDTTTHVLQWLVLNLAENPDKQGILRQEVLRVLGKDGTVNSENLPHLVYLNNCFRESHRLTPPGIITTYRKTVIELDVCGYSIPAGTKVNIATGPIQMDPTLVDEPTKFIPERWSEDEVKKREGTAKEIIDHSLLKRPFSFGPRMCLGARVAELEMKTMVSHMVRRYKFEVSPKDQAYKVVNRTFAKAEPYPQFCYQIVQ